MNEKLLTVIMPLKNGMPFLRDSVNSILNQSFRKFYFLIVNDCSDDDSLIYLKKINDSRIKIINNYGKGIAAALNTGLYLADTRYVAIMDADDISTPERFTNQIDLLENEKEIVLVGTSIKYFSNEKSNRHWKVYLPADDQKIKQGLRNGKYVLSHPTIMIRTEALKDIGGYNENAYPVFDLDMYLRLSSKGKYVNLKDSFSFIRLHNNSFTSKHLFEITKKIYSLSHNLDNKENFHHSLAIKLKCLSTKYYKKGLMKYLNGSNVFWILYLFIAALFDLPKSLYYVKNKMVI